MKNITRRTFLKTTGAAALAVGAVGMLGGCGLVDNAINNALKDQLPNAKVVNSVMVTCDDMIAVRNDSVWNEGTQEWNGGEIRAVTVQITLANLGTNNVSLKKENFTLKLDGAETTLVPGDAGQELIKDSCIDFRMLLDNKGEKVLTKEMNENRADSGWVVFQLKNPVADWAKAELTVQISDQVTFDITKKGEQDTDIKAR